jgi:hypothetical protein
MVGKPGLGDMVNLRLPGIEATQIFRRLAAV